jgi:hypothetical protein
MNSVGPGVTSTVWWEIDLCEPGGPQVVSAEKIAEIHPHAKTIMIGLEVATSTKELSTCFSKWAKKFGLEVINQTNNEADTAAGSQKVFEPLLTKYPEVEAVWCYNDESAMGVSAALLAGGKTIATADNPEGVVVTGHVRDRVRRHPGDERSARRRETERPDRQIDPRGFGNDRRIRSAGGPRIHARKPSAQGIEGRPAAGRWKRRRAFTAAGVGPPRRPPAVQRSGGKIWVAGPAAPGPSTRATHFDPSTRSGSVTRSPRIVTTAR